MTQTVPAGPFAIGDDDPFDVLSVFVSGTIDGAATLFNLGNPLDATANADMLIISINQGMITTRFRLELDGGWNVLGTMIYDSNLPLVSAFRTEPTIGIDSLDLTFVNPSGEVVLQQSEITGGVGQSTVTDIQFNTRLADFVPSSFVSFGSDMSGEPIVIGDSWSFSELIIGGSTIDTAAVTRLSLDFRCNPADLAPPFGLNDLTDIDAFIPLFIAADPAVDLAPPLGLIDLADIDTFITAFLAGCP